MDSSSVDSSSKTQEVTVYSSTRASTAEAKGGNLVALCCQGPSRAASAQAF
jgi:hypothetical protein